MSSRFKDFDAFFAEQKREPLRFRLFGEEHELPPALPAGVMLEILRLQAEARLRGEDPATARVPDDAVLRMAEALFGRERLDALVAKGLDVEQMAEIIRWAVQAYRAGGQGNATTPPAVEAGA